MFPTAHNEIGNSTTRTQEQGNEDSRSHSPVPSLRPAPYFYYVDRSTEPDDDPFSPIVPLGRHLNFPSKMHAMLDRADFADIVSWMPHGRSWRIHNTPEFESKVMPLFWDKCTNITSFLRQARLWGFIRLGKGEDKNSYYHEYFLRGLPSLCKKMQRSDQKGSSGDNNKRGRRKMVPDLSAISRLHPLIPQSADTYHMELLRAVMQQGPNGRMDHDIVVVRQQAVIQQSITSTIMSRGAVQHEAPPIQQQLDQSSQIQMQKNEESERVQNMPQSLLQQHLPHQSTPQRDQHEEEEPQYSVGNDVHPPLQQQLPTQSSTQQQDKKDLEPQLEIVQDRSKPPLQQQLSQLSTTQQQQNEVHRPQFLDDNTEQNPQQGLTQQQQHEEPDPSLQQHIPLQTQMDTMENSLHLHLQLTRWQALLLAFIRLELGGVSTWSWLTGWWIQHKTTPIWTEEEEQREIGKLSMPERLCVMADLVGSTASSSELTQEEQYFAISLLQKDIDGRPPQEKAELEEARRKCSQLVDENWLLLFLRTENYDVQAAAKRLIAYWQNRVDILGREKSFLRLTIQNTFPDEEHIRNLNFGIARILPVTDLFGRSIVFFEPGRIHGQNYSTAIMKISWLYICHAAMDAGANGVVLIVYGKTVKPGHANLDLAASVIKTIQCMPFCVKALHSCCFNRLIQKVLFPFTKYFATPFYRSRLLEHSEVGDELLEEFRRYGLPPERLPTELGGKIELNHEKWVKERLSKGL